MSDNHACTTLRVEQWFEDGVHNFVEFDQPEKLARASEGFCPFRIHNKDKAVGEELVDVAVPLQPLEIDGQWRVLCTVDQVVMRFYWLDSYGNEVKSE